MEYLSFAFFIKTPESEIYGRDLIWRLPNPKWHSQGLAKPAA
jgi:hypothetical protein